MTLSQVLKRQDSLKTHVTMIVFVITCVSLLEDMLQYWTHYKYKREAQEAADHFVLCYNNNNEST